MKLRKTALALGAVMALSTTSAYARTLEFKVNDSTMYISDGTIKSDPLEVAPYIENGRTMVPVRVISENFGAEVGWDDTSRTITITDGTTNVVLTVDSLEATVNGEVQTLDAAPVIVNDRTMVPLRFISEALNRSVEYIEPSSQILISDEKPVLTVDGVPVTIDDYRFVLAYYGISGNKEELSVMLPEVTNFLVQNIALANVAKAAGVTVEKDVLDGLVSQFDSEKDLIYKTSLMAPGIKLVCDQQTVNSFLDNYDFGITNESITELYNNNYVCAKHILVLTTDPVSGEAKSDAEKKKAKSTAETILKKVKKGEDFDKLIEEYNEDPGMASYPDGYVFTYGEMVKEFEDATLALKEGETSGIVESSFGYHIILRCELPEIDEATIYSLGQQAMQVQVNNVVANIVSNSQVAQLVSDEEIVNALVAD